MADNTETDVNELKRLRQLNFEQSKQISLLREFTKASDGATKAIIDKVTPSLIKLVEGSSALSAEIKKEVTSHKAAAIAIEKAFKNLHEAKKLADELKAGTKSAGDVKVALKALGIELEDGRTNAQKIANTFAKLDKESDRLTAGFADATQQLSKSSVKLSKELDGMRSRVTANIQNFFTLTSALGLATKAVTKFYDLGLDLVNKGMVGAMMTITTQSMALRMSVSELSELLGKSRGTILAIGGGQKGVNGFLDAVKRTSQGLELFGKDAAKISAGILDTLTKNGAGFGNKKIGEETLLYAEKMRDQYKEMYSLFGDSAEEFTNYYDQLLKTESLQARLNTLSSSQIRLMMQENMQRYESYRLMGLSNEQITNMNRTLETLYNPSKNQQVEAIKERYMGRAAISMSSNDLTSSGDKQQVELGNRLKSALETGAYDKLRQASPQQQAEMIANDKLMEQLVKDLAANDDYQRQQRDMSRGRESLYGYGATAARGQAGETHDSLVRIGQQLNQAKIAGGDIRGESPAEKRRREEMRANAGFKTGADGRAADMTASAEAFATLRTAVDQVSSLMANPLVYAIGAATAALVLFTASLGGASLASKAKDLLKGGGSFMGKAGLAGAAGYGIGEYIVNPIVNKVSSLITGNKDETLGTALYGWMGGDKKADNAMKASNRPTLDYNSPTPAPASTPKGKFAGFGDDIDSYITEASKKYGLDEKTLRGFIKMEDGYTGKMSPTGAIGTGQFIQKTWNNLSATKEGQEIGMTSINRNNFRTNADPRRDQKTNTMATALLAKQNADILIKNGIEPTGENLYMLHNIGPGIIPALRGGNVGADTWTAMQQNGMRPGQTPADFVKMQKSKFNQQYEIANSVPVGKNQMANTAPITSVAGNRMPNTTPIMNAVAQGGPQTLTPAQVAATAGTVATASQGPDGLLLENQKQTALMAQQAASLSTIVSSIVKNRTTEGLQADRQIAAVIG